MSESAEETDTAIEVQIKAAVEDADSQDEVYELLNAARDAIAEASPVSDNPVDIVKWVPIEQCR